MDRVHTIEAVYDGVPLSGIADYQGHPHIYHRQFDHEKDDWSDRYTLKKIGPDLMALAMERHELFLEWRKAFDAGHLPLSTHPRLALDNTRYNQLEEILAPRIAALPDTATLIGRFDDVSFDQFAGSVQWSSADLR